MADDPADVGRRPECLAGLHVVDVRHRPAQRDEIAADVAHHAFRDAGRAGGVEDIERIGRLQLDAAAAPCLPAAALRPLPAPNRGRARRHASLRPAAAGARRRRRACGAKVHRRVEQRLVGDDAAGLDAAGGGQDQLRLGVLDAGGEFLGGEAAEHDRMHGADARAGEHAGDRLGDHRHVDDDAVAGADAEIGETAASVSTSASSSRVGDPALRAGDGAVVVKGGLIATSRRDMPVERVVAGVASGVGKPAAVDAGFRVENALRRLDPIDGLGGLGPKGLRVLAPLRVDGSVAAAHGVLPQSLRPFFARGSGKGNVTRGSGIRTGLALVRRSGVKARRLIIRLSCDHPGPRGMFAARSGFFQKRN